MDSFANQIFEIKPRDHLCLIYEEESEWRKTVIAFLISGLKREEKCIYISGNYSSDYVRKQLLEAGVEVAKKEKEGQLEFIEVNGDLSNKNNSILHLEVDFLEKRIKQALAKGYSGLRITGEVFFTKKLATESKKVLEYELSRDLFLEYPLAMLCRYNLNSFSAATIREIISLHAYVIWKQEIYRNPLYISPKKLQLKKNSSKSELIHWLRNIKKFNNLEKRYQNKLEQRQEQLKNKNKELKDLLYITSHDLRSPLINIQGFSQEIKMFSEQSQELISKVVCEDELVKELKTILAEDIPEAINYITESTKQINNLLNGLLKLSRISHSTLNWEKVEIKRLLREIINNFEYRLQKKNIEIEIDSNLPDCKGDKLKIVRVFSNLIDNAIKYSAKKEHGKIIISGWKEEDNIIYTVKDNGFGIKEAEQQEIFSIFKRGSNNQSIQGAGIGLTIVKRIVELHNGKIYLDSELGQGSEFFIVLPKFDEG